MRGDTMADVAGTGKLGMTVRCEVRVQYAQLYLADEHSWGRADWDELYFGKRPCGLLAVAAGEAILTTGLRSGVVPVAVAVVDRDPGAELDGYQDVVEVSFEACYADLSLIEGAGERSHPLPTLSAGAGWYRMRYHCRGMDQGFEANANFDVGRVIDEYLLQIWPAPDAPSAVLKVASRLARQRIYDTGQNST
jgi:hypothetical protein